MPLVHRDRHSHHLCGIGGGPVTWPTPTMAMSLAATERALSATYCDGMDLADLHNSSAQVGPLAARGVPVALARTGPSRLRQSPNAAAIGAS